jgi:hypothetical protein
MVKDVRRVPVTEVETTTTDTKTREPSQSFEYTLQYDSEMPIGWRHRTTRWDELNKWMDQVGNGTHKNVRVNLPNHEGINVTQAINTIRGAMYRWATTVVLDPDYRVYTRSGVENDVPYIIGWVDKI